LKAGMLLRFPLVEKEVNFCPIYNFKQPFAKNLSRFSRKLDFSTIPLFTHYQWIPLLK
jgi:hypothetical protein